MTKPMMPRQPVIDVDWEEVAAINRDVAAKRARENGDDGFAGIYEDGNKALVEVCQAEWTEDAGGNGADKAARNKPRQAAAEEGDPPHWHVTPWIQEVSGADLLDTICNVLERYMILPKHAADAMALWVVHAWCFAAWIISPLLIVVSPVMQCGKSTLLTVLFWILPRSELTANASASPIFRLIEDAKPDINTFLFDEGDTYFTSDKEDLRGIINSGWIKMTARVMRTDGDGNKRKARRFSTWAPKIIATIKAVADTLMDRGIIIKLRRATRVETRKIERFRMLDTGEFSELRQKCLRWASDHIEQLAEADPTIPDALANRAADNWRPLLAIADAAGGEWPKRARAAALVLSGASSKVDRSIDLLEDVRRVFNDGKPEWLGAEILVNRLVDLPETPWAEWRRGEKPITSRAVAKMLAEFEIKSKRDMDLRKYYRADFETAWDSYLT